jgi:hypothetical protein
LPVKRLPHCLSHAADEPRAPPAPPPTAEGIYKPPLAPPSSKPLSSPLSPPGAGGPRHGENPVVSHARAGPRIFVGKLTKDTTEADVKEYFSRWGVEGLGEEAGEGRSCW